jgi:serine O-acetyltransferase
VLGPIVIGDYSRIGANSVVVKDVPPNSVVVGVPGRISSQNGEKVRDPVHEDLHHDRLNDITMESVAQLSARLELLEQALVDQQQDDAAQTQVVSEGYQGPWGI